VYYVLDYVDMEVILEMVKTVVEVGVVGSYNAQWDTVNEFLADDNIKVELVSFSSYAEPKRS
jgi:D-methionine transport system substrate-binding protein